MNCTIGQTLGILAKTKEKETKEVLRALLEEIISNKYPEEQTFLSYLVKEAVIGKTATTLGNGVLAPDFTSENIISEVDNGHTIVRW